MHWLSKPSGSRGHASSDRPEIAEHRSDDPFAHDALPTTLSGPHRCDRGDPAGSIPVVARGGARAVG